MLRWIFGILTGMLITISIFMGMLLIKSDDKIEESTPGNKPDYHLQIIMQDTDEYYWTYFKEGAKAAEKEFGVYVEFVPISQRTVANLRETVEKGMIAGVDGIALQAADSDETVNIIAEAKKQGTPIITYENGNYIIPDTPTVGSNSYNIGSIAGNMAVEATEGKGKVAVILNKGENSGDNASKNLIIQGIIDSFSRYSTININKIYTLNKDMFEVEKIVSDILSDPDKTDTIICLDERSTPGIAQALVDNNIVGDIKFIGYGLMPLTLDYIKRGVIYSSVVPNSYDIGYYTVKQLTECIKGEQISDSISTELYTIDANNVNQYADDMNNEGK